MISGVSNPTTSTTANAGTAKTAAEMQNQFLTLLVAQLQNQDPMSPMDNAQMTSQMAQISTVTGIEKLNETVNNVTGQFSMMQMVQGTSMIGRTVLSEGNTLAAAGEGVYTAAFDLSGSAANVKVQITTPAGQLVDTVELGSGAPGRNYFTWNAGNYQGDASQLRYNVVATNGESAVNATTLTPYSVIAATTSNGNLMLELNNGSSIAYSNIKAVY
ncbi:MAG: flagellar hook capping FlgD N-terminal domain-containing protein [Comamonadaceae bacterium]|nr:flagellar hook capping FlgD N-terminal domain-containing protein [Comamonadaceae bacterium]